MSMAAAMIGGSLLSGGIGLLGSKSAADAQTDAANRASATQLQMFNTTRRDMEPWRFGGQRALSAYLYEMGLGDRPEAYNPGDIRIYDQDNNVLRKKPGTLQSFANPAMTSNVEYGTQNMPFPGPAQTTSTTSPGAPTFRVGDREFDTWEAARAFQRDQYERRNTSFDYEGFKQSPGYRFVLEESQKAINRQNAATGKFFSGEGLKEAMRYRTGLASQEYGAYMNRLANAAQIGQTQTNTLASLGANVANNQAANTLQAGQARASGYLGMANAANQTIGNLGQYYMLSQMGAFA